MYIYVCIIYICVIKYVSMYFYIRYMLTLLTHIHCICTHIHMHIYTDIYTCSNIYICASIYQHMMCVHVIEVF